MQELIVTWVFSHSVNALKPWAGLHLLIWLAFAHLFGTGFSELCCAIYLHFLVGLAVLILAMMNYHGLTRTYVPDRLKRLSKVTPGMAAFDWLLGIPLYVFANEALHGRSTFCS
jgi:hypothetical protein